MDYIRLGLTAFALSGCLIAAAAAQQDDIFSDEYFTAPPTDYGAGYKMIMVKQHQEHASGKGYDDTPTVTLNLSYPIISSPLTPDAIAYNETIEELIGRWWKDIGAPQDNSQKADPGTDYTLICTPGAGIGNGESSPLERMLPGTISMSCSAYFNPHGNGHGGGYYWGFNWLVAQRRSIEPEDIFTPDSGWLKALTALANKDRGSDLASFAPKLDYADRHRWVIGADGMGLNYSMGEFAGLSEGGDGEVVLIGWSKLAPYLRKGGIVPQSDWTAKGLTDLFPNLPNSPEP